MFLGFTIKSVAVVFYVSVCYNNNSGSMPSVLAKHKDG